MHNQCRKVCNTSWLRACMMMYFSLNIYTTCDDAYIINLESIVHNHAVTQTVTYNNQNVLYALACYKSID